MKSVNDKCFLKLNQSFPTHLMLLYDIFTPSFIFWPPIIFTSMRKSENCMYEKKKGYRVKISKSYIIPNRKWPIYIIKVLLENLYHVRFSFYKQSQFLHISLSTVLIRGLIKHLPSFGVESPGFGLNVLYVYCLTCFRLPPVVQHWNPEHLLRPQP